MRRTVLTVAVIAVSVLVQPALAQQSTEPATKQSAAQEKAVPPETERTSPRPAIRVLQHPYEISGFYRSGESPLGPWAGLPNDPTYKIAGFYRAHQGGYPSSPYGWSAFWTNGYSAPRPAPFPGYRRTIGENGDLFLMVPFLAPVGPLNSAFLGY
jgi:hypothetical protein